MKIQLLSDVHWEFLSNEHSIPDIEATDSDVVVLAGDIHTGVHGIQWAAKQQKRLNKPIIYVAGNHEYYQHDLYALNQALKQSAKAHNVHLLQNNSVVINEVRFLGATLWTNFGEHHTGLMTIAHNNINDYRFITADKWWQTQRSLKITQKYFKNHEDIEEHKGQFLPHVAYDEHKKSIRWLTKELEKSFDGKTVIITHHAPSYLSLKPLIDIDYVTQPKVWIPHARDRLGIYKVAGYASDLSQLLSQYHQTIDLWMHGHTHCQLDYIHKGVRVVANPIGYPRGKRDEFSNQIFSIMFKTSRLEKIDHDPAEGDVTTFNPRAFYDLDDGLYPTLLPQLKDYYQQWRVLMDESKALKSYM
ncbi:MAG: metallophosphoesterase family protein [gamma proteobacterium symbiont of Bathyaustriella thionipta]|nr:metallophosphoesterase family protein [gamma proteobacterium symbiont of Bathyaustriella thionipta]MCU7950671.1 metallophosphoesterase family protein [gamma proteobacterium symbiont of Bathyaustriella thionipta]MCU7954017.1 metallophosphoesterase family protein [gamma proteobacterium symbiont of Bathyaustriella thionipta]MCU7958032.1 metallophosphoesterase family protein [gamma proteobacterium symbiont of Bathyaustriella thionipta]MCU7967529.1 metallophosphoesterase family protein [gamma pro